MPHPFQPSDHTVTEVYEVYLSYELGPDGVTKLPTLWDPDNGRRQHNAVRAVWLVHDLPDQITLTTDPDAIDVYLDPETAEVK